MSTAGEARAVAHANIALAKYWGKLDEVENLPAVPSLSLTLAGLSTTTLVRLDPGASEDSLVLDGRAETGKARERATRLLSEVRRRAGSSVYARVESSNDFPTASGLASSASGFAALALAASSAYALDLVPAEVSSLARRSSASAARSVYGGYVELGAGARSASPVLSGEAWPLRMVIAVTASGPKSIGSTSGMQRTRDTSPYYAAWVEHAPRRFEEARAALLARDFETLGAAVEQSALMMHASMLAARPSIQYFTPATLRVMAEVRALRNGGVPAFFTMDAGPHVKVLCEPASAAAVEQALAQLEGVERLIVTGPGPDARCLEPR
ncbi:MAG TPA: diphosphomevalonate decarboxylase [Polyangiaceae bacterium]